MCEEKIGIFLSWKDRQSNFSVNNDWRNGKENGVLIDVEVCLTRCVGSVTKNFVYFTYSQTHQKKEAVKYR